MRPPLRLTLGLAAAAAALTLLPSCSRTDARAGTSAGSRGAAPIESAGRASSESRAPGADSSPDSAPGAARWGDSDSDGIPDAEELRSFGDRQSFRRWFTTIAEEQFYAPSPEWNAGQRDCAGLVRFAWREALRQHDRAWFLRMGQGYEPVAPDVRAYTLERSPVGEKLFRAAPGSFGASDLADGTFSEFADARTLREFNSRYVGRDARRAEPGDLLFFHQPWVQKYPYHVMLFLGRSRADSGAASDWVVYHTGASVSDAGEVRLARLSVLARHPDPRWRPVAGNRNFLGFYRLKILE